ncbi:hypothetical protein [Streptomyces sp. NRRL WC-3742]|uniref:hypothetical protein n=1 Tax=Streptomyces sp. NRRL WC-3742 TaxID=1463934 RepID=UPI00055EEB96|nr:hypothetical protein [Streptomyces sp. NRRL WC-3742]
MSAASAATPRVSASVMTHPVRRAQAEELAARLGVGNLAVDPDPDAGPSALRTALVAWGQAEATATHHLMVQDDVAAPADLIDLVTRAAARFPEDALVFYTNWHARNGALSRLAALAGAAWVRGVPQEFTPTLAVCLPVEMAARYREFGRRSTDRHDDEVLSAFLRPGGRMALLAVPNVTEHTGTSSINGHASQGVRKAACPVDEATARPLLAHGPVLERPDWLPYMRNGEGYLQLSWGTESSAHIPWREALPHTGMSEEALRGLEASHRPAEAVRAVADAFGDRYAEELWLHAVLLGAQAEAVAGRLGADRPRASAGPEQERLRVRAVSTLGLASLPAEQRPGVTPGQAALLTEYAWSAISCGSSLLSELGRRG